MHAQAAKLGQPGDVLPNLAVPGLLGRDVDFEFQMPEDILTSAPYANTDAIHYGVSYVFFAVCAGELRLVSGPANRLPFGCFDPASGKELAASDYVEGFSTIFSFEGNVNQNPVLSRVLFNGAKVAAGECSEDADCVDVDSGSEAFHDYACGKSGQCVPRVDRCDPKHEQACPEYSVFPEIAPESAEPDPGAATDNGTLPGEILWVNFFADAGSFSSDTRLAHDRQSGWIDNWESRFRPLRDQAGSVRLFVTLHDNRGGAAWQSFEVLVRDPQQ